MSGLDDFRAQNPDYKSVPDNVLADALYKKFYSSVPRDQFDAKLGLNQPPPPAEPPPNTAVDMARVVPGGLAKAVGSIVGFPGDIRSMMDAGSRYILEKTGLSKPQQTLSGLITGAPATPQPDVNTFVPKAPTSGQIVNTLAELFGGLYKPKTTAGKYTETAVSFLPAALAPGSVLQRAARVLVPSTASEAAGQFTEGTPIEPYARAGGAILGGGLVGLGEGLMSERAQSAATPTTPQVQQNAANQYQAISGTPVTITPDMARMLSGDLGNRALEHAITGASARPEPQFQAIATELENLRNGATAGQTLSVDAADRVSRAFRDIGRGAMRGDNPNTDLSAGAFARRAGVETTVGQVPGVQPARAAYAQGQKAADIDAAIQRAVDSPATPAGASGIHQAIKREFKGLVRDEDFMRGLTDAEREAVKRAANGTLTSNSLQRVAVFSPLRNHLSAIAELLTGGILGSGAAGAGIVGQVTGNFAAMRNARLASELVRSGGTATPMMAAPIARNAAIAALLSRQPGQ